MRLLDPIGHPLAPSHGIGGANMATRGELRPFDIARDQRALADLCANVYGGRDYMPTRAATYAADPACEMLVLEGKDELAAIANYRRISAGVAWLEGMRTAEAIRGGGVATHLVRHLCTLAAGEGRALWSCTIASNAPMLRVFAKAGLIRRGSIGLLAWDSLRALPGWGEAQRDESGERHPQSMSEEAAEEVAEKPVPLLRSLGLESLVSDRAKRVHWKPVRTAATLDARLKSIGHLGEDLGENLRGLVPGLYKLHHVSGTAIAESLRLGQVEYLGADEVDGVGGVLALVRDESLGVEWVRGSWDELELAS